MIEAEVAFGAVAQLRGIVRSGTGVLGSESWRCVTVLGRSYRGRGRGELSGGRGRRGGGRGKRFIRAKVGRILLR